VSDDQSLADWLAAGRARGINGLTITPDDRDETPSRLSYQPAQPIKVRAPKGKALGIDRLRVPRTEVGLTSDTEVKRRDAGGRTKIGTRGGASSIPFGGPGMGRGSTLIDDPKGVNISPSRVPSRPTRGETHQGSNATALLTGILENPSGGAVDKRCNKVPPPKL